MKKKSLLLLLAFAVVMFCVGGIFGTLFLKDKKGDDKTTTAPAQKAEQHAILSDDIALYFDLGQLVEKSAINSTMTDANRALVASMIAPENAEYVQSILENLDNTGINTNKPIYGYANITSVVDEEFGVTLVAQVKDADMIDRFIDFVSENTGEEIAVVREGDMRTIDLDEAIVGYNSDRFIIVTGECDDYNTLLNEAFERPIANLSAYAKYDIAFSMQIMSLVDATRTQLQMSVNEYVDELEMCEDEWEVEWIEESLASAEEQLKAISEIENVLSQDANAILGLAFEDGRVLFEACVNGVSDEFSINRKVNNNYLDYVDRDAMAFVNIGVDGKKISELLSKYLPENMAETLDMDRNEYNVYSEILFDAIKSINGDVAIALNDISVSRYGSVEGVEALVSIDVADNYIFSNISQFGAGMLNKVNDNLYSISFYGFNINIGQGNDTLYATVNMKYEEREEPASDARWAKDIKNSYGYVLIDFDSIVANNYVYTACRRAMDMNSSDFDNFAQSLSHVYFSATSPYSVEFVIAFDDKNTNALENIVKQMSAIAMGEMTREMMEY